jgi:hypothetical protein
MKKIYILPKGNYKHIPKPIPKITPTDIPNITPATNENILFYTLYFNNSLYFLFKIS